MRLSIETTTEMKTETRIETTTEMKMEMKIGEISNMWFMKPLFLQLDSDFKFLLEMCMRCLFI